MEQALDLYLLDCSTRLSPKTMRWYTEKLNAFRGWCQAQGVELEQLTSALVHRYILLLQTTPSSKTGQPLSTYTVHGYAQVVMGFLHWCEENEYLGHVRVKMPKVKQQIIETLTHSQFKALFAATSQEETPWLAARDRAILLVLLDTGVRASELCGLARGDVFLKEGYLRVLGKGNKEREVGFGAQTKYHLSRYLMRYRPSGVAGEWVFVNKRREPLTVSGLDQMLYRLRDWAGVEGVRCSAHTLRHTAAVEALLQGEDMYAVSRKLGHTSVQTTQIYVQSTKDRDLRRHSASVVDKLLR